MVDAYAGRDLRQERLSGEVRDVDFDPSDFGFELYVPKRFGGDRRDRDKDYVTYSPGSERTTRCMTLSLCEDTADFISELIGDEVNIYINDKGQLLVCEGSLSRLAKKQKGSTRRTISMAGLTEKMFKAHGDFRKLYLVAKPYARGNAVIFSPTGERAAF